MVLHSQDGVQSNNVGLQEYTLTSCTGIHSGWMDVVAFPWGFRLHSQPGPDVYMHKHICSTVQFNSVQYNTMLRTMKQNTKEQDTTAECIHARSCLHAGLHIGPSCSQLADKQLMYPCAGSFVCGCTNLACSVHYLRRGVVGVIFAARKLRMMLKTIYQAADLPWSPETLLSS